MRRSVLFVVSLVLAISLAGADGALAQQPKRGGVIRIAEREAPGLDPHLSISFLTHSYVSLTYSMLVRFPNGPEQKSPTDFSILPDLKNAMIPVISLIGLQRPLYIGGSVIIEAIVRLPGVGLFFFEALNKLDYPVVQSVNLIIAAMVVGLNLLIDLSYAFLDPRIRYR